MGNDLNKLNKITDTGIEPIDQPFRSISNKKFVLVDTSGYSNIRGMLVPKQIGFTAFDDTRKFTFQFNPEEIKIDKEASWSVRNTPGLDYNDYIWGNGGERTISFRLFVDATAGSYTPYFLQSNYDDENNIERVQEARPRGVLPQCELLESFLHPEIPSPDPLATVKAGKLKKAIIVPKFSSGGVVPPDQFFPPPALIFVYGNGFYSEGILKSANFNYSTFRKDLVPLRCEIDVVFGVFEHIAVKISNKLLPVVI